MKKHEYIKQHAQELSRLCKKRDKISETLQSSSIREFSPKFYQKQEAELNWTSMHIGQTEERLLFALGAIRPDEARAEWKPSAWHRYDGIRAELERTELE